MALFRVAVTIRASRQMVWLPTLVGLFLSLYIVDASDQVNGQLRPAAQTFLGESQSLAQQQAPTLGISRSLGAMNLPANRGIARGTRRPRVPAASQRPLSRVCIFAVLDYVGARVMRCRRRQRDCHGGWGDHTGTRSRHSAVRSSATGLSWLVLLMDWPGRGHCLFIPGLHSARLEMG